MKHRKTEAILPAMMLALSLFAGCGQTAQPEPSGLPATSLPTSLPTSTSTAEPTSEPTAGPAAAAVTVTDMTGREITLEEPATRIVALTASDCEIIYAIGAGDALVGRGEYCDYPAEVLDVPSVQSGNETNIEQIIALEPRLLLMSTMAQTEEQVAALEAAGVKVVVSDAHDIAGVYTAIELIGKLMGKEAEAAAVIDRMKTTFDEIAAGAAGDGSKTVYFEVSPLEYGLWTAGTGTFMNEICEMLGLKNAFADVTGWGEISEEQVLQRNPDYIVTVSMYWGDGPSPVEEIMSRDGWDSITAVRNGDILNLRNNELSRPGPRLADGAQLMFDFVY
jgi:iron complex transport system substrate-binding protein